MLSVQSKAVVEKAKRLYEGKLRSELEPRNMDKYLCIEPESGRYFLGDTLDEAVNAALDAFPGRVTHTLRIGHSAALHLGVLVQ